MRPGHELLPNGKSCKTLENKEEQCFRTLWGGLLGSRRTQLSVTRTGHLLPLLFYQTENNSERSMLFSFNRIQIDFKNLPKKIIQNCKHAENRLDRTPLVADFGISAGCL